MELEEFWRRTSRLNSYSDKRCIVVRVSVLSIAESSTRGGVFENYTAHFVKTLHQKSPNSQITEIRILWEIVNRHF